MATHIEETRNCVANLEIQLKETKSKLAKYKDCDSNLDYVQRVADLEEGSCQRREAKAIYDLAVKEEENEADSFRKPRTVPTFYTVGNCCERAIHAGSQNGTKY
jgi:hypothetical protein